MENQVNELIQRFNLKNNLTQNFNIWVGHAKIGFEGKPSIEETKTILLDLFDEFVEEGEPVPRHLQKTLAQWEDFHPYQKVREIDQPMFISRQENKAFVVVIWPWQIKEGVASLMLYQGEFLE